MAKRWALASGRIPRGLRILLVSITAALLLSAGLLAYRSVTRPTVLTIATGSVDGDSTRLISAIAARMVATDSPVRLKVIDRGTALDAVDTFASGGSDLAVVRRDVGDLSAARTIVILTHAVVLIAVPSADSVDGMDALKGKTVGVIAGPVNRTLVATVGKAYELDRAKVIFKDISPADVGQALQSKQIQALLLVMPISEKYLGMLRDMLPRNAKTKLGLVPIDLAGAIAASSPAYESYDLPKGTVRGSPALPEEDLTTLRVPFYLVANKQVPDHAAAALAKALVEARRDLAQEYPLLGQISAPSEDKEAYIPRHPGAATYFGGEEVSLVDKYADKLFYLFMLLGFCVSALAAVWKFMMTDTTEMKDAAVERLCGLADRVRTATSESELADAEREVDDVLAAQLERYSRGKAEAAEAAPLAVAVQRVERLIQQRRTCLDSLPQALLNARNHL